MPIWPVFVYALKSFSGNLLPAEAIASPVPGPVRVWMAQLLPTSCSRVCVHAPSYPKDKIFPIMVQHC